jgi:Domain of unknown function (DUF4397)
MRKSLAFLVPCALLVAGGMGSALAQPLGATVTVLHGLPAFTADVYVNGELTLDGFEPLDSTDPFELAEGEYRIEIRDVGAAPDSEPALEATANVVGGTNVSVVPHLAADGSPTVTIFSNDFSPVGPGNGLFVARHVAEASGLEVLVDGESTLTGLSSQDEGTTTLPAGSHTVEVVAGGSGDALLGPIDFSLREGTAQAIYVVGSAEDQTLDIMSQTIPDLQSPPAAVSTGDGGLADRRGMPGWMAATMVAFAAGAITSGAVMVTRRRKAIQG